MLQGDAVTPTNNNRLPWIDTMRGICMIAILLFHTEVYYADGIITPYQCYVHNALAGFFFISGYLFIGDKGFSFAHKIKSIARSLVLPYFIFTIILGVLKIVFQHADATEVFTKIILGQASWFAHRCRTIDVHNDVYNTWKNTLVVSLCCAFVCRSLCYRQQTQPFSTLLSTKPMVCKRWYACPWNNDLRCTLPSF